MRAFLRVMFATLSLALLAACARPGSAVPAGQSFALAPDLTVRLASFHPSLTQLQLEITLLPTGSTSIESLVQAVVVIPSGGREVSSSLDFKQAGALITMLLADAQKVDSVTVRDARSGASADWSVQPAETLLPCKTSNQCELIGMPNAQSLPGRP